MNKIIYQQLRTPNGFYIYDRSLDTIFTVTEDEYKEFKRLQHSEMASQSPVIKRYQKRGLLCENDVTVIQHPATDVLQHYCRNSLSSMILQVTQQCNLRCSYCAYSGAYHNRTHNSARMSFETAKKAIDFFLAKTRESSNIHFGFYGGEPLLEFDLIKCCVSYIKKVVEGKTVSFGITTNGTLLTDAIIQFLYENDFQLTVSIDGSKQEHDSCRVFPDGSGSFDIVMRNIRRVKELYSDYANKLMVSTVISPKADLNNMLEYFTSDEILSDTSMIMTPVTETGLKEQVNYKDSFFQVRKYEYLKLLLSLVGKLDQKDVSKLVAHSQRNFELLYRKLQQHIKTPSCIHHGGPCVPGLRRLFVMTDGRLFPCEKVGQSARCNQIGTIDSGFDLDNMNKLLNIGSLTANECKDCWALLNCKICAAELEYTEGQKEFTKKNKLKACEKSKRLAMTDLYEMCVLHEFGYRLNEEVIIL